MQTIEVVAHDPLTLTPSPTTEARPTLRQLKDGILKRRRQRIRRTTYAYVAEKIIEDTAPENPYRVPLVLDWWHRVVDPLEAESFDAERLPYFRERLEEHRKAPAHNAAIRQGLLKAEPMRRVSARKVGYWRLQIARLTDRRLNFAAATQAVLANDQAFEQLLLGLIALPRLRPSAGSWVDRAARWAAHDRRADAIFQRAMEDPGCVAHDLQPRRVAERIGQLRNPFDRIWLYGEDYVSTKAAEGLTRKLHDKYSNYFSGLRQPPLR